ncbi:AGE family epimerase/isomerase [Paenibacillus methanolicus]|uniref:Cellobiose 2-epimerase n=1 Tax=Paenibacillus methanolicus TaxID=582686 RepID=A0A5S5CC71_9BACL|nr:AGE family epimerase/isomerase [Paenibacillus methanolicus]TYP76759.1 mannobiose 2-epimerase [Paenibacillus methanolicus]
MDYLQWKEELQSELQQNILRFWIEHTVDAEHGGFIGEIDGEMMVNSRADKGLVLNARILWSFAAAYRLYPEPAYKAIADLAYAYLKDRFTDREHGGLFWSVDYAGQPVETKKQVYGQAFYIYALAEYDRAFGSEEALAIAIRIYRLLERHAYDPRHKGYIEALARDWQPTDKLSLSDKDLNVKKSMNTHLHVLEAYTNLYRVWKSEELRSSLQELIEVTLDHIIDPEHPRFQLFFDDNWQIQGHHISYGHDIEGSWLLYEAAEVLGESGVLERVRGAALAMAEAVLAEGIDQDGGIWNEADASGVTDANKDWWPQAEAMVGFYNAYQLTGSDKYLQAARQSWTFIQTYIVDKEGGEWHWGVDPSGKPLAGQPKVSPWKCPYHNSRACIELLERLGARSAH